jgi:hypothetical protein
MDSAALSSTGEDSNAAATSSNDTFCASQDAAKHIPHDSAAEKIPKYRLMIYSSF